MFTAQSLPHPPCLSDADNHTSTKTSPPWGSLAIIAAMVIGGLALETEDGRGVHLRGIPAAVLPEVCWSKRWLGWSCPLCGATRSVIYLVRGRWVDSWSMQPAGSLVLLAAVISAGIAWMAYLRGEHRRWTTSLLTQALWLGLFIFLVIRHAAISAGWMETLPNPPRTHASALSVR